MRHALIIDDNMIVSRAIQNRLQAYGFDSFDHSWSEDQAVDAAANHPPDLIVVGDTLVHGSPLEVGRKIALTSAVPMLVLTADACSLQRSLPKGGAIEGPFKLSELDAALVSATLGV